MGGITGLVFIAEENWRTLGNSTGIFNKVEEVATIDKAGMTSSVSLHYQIKEDLNKHIVAVS